MNSTMHVLVLEFHSDLKIEKSKTFCYFLIFVAVLNAVLNDLFDLF